LIDIADVHARAFGDERARDLEPIPPAPAVTGSCQF
jgi:hypothetical protein